MSDRALVIVLALATLALLIAASVTGSAVPGWAAIATFAASLVAYVRWRLGRRRLF
ncbi:MAG TPA: hypothetical protein VFI37_11085 [Gaiellaceae bacterium]|jgi:hypothetical protein|nr:hypothetical protein [Gaiellaceae bacterium]